uniref:Uncharacterized protein n=1 Tax=Biomphalaria glabrata TaxID=6526 RepID=A0A2C9M025_BIOGL
MVTCKITVDVALAQLVRRLIIDEIPQLLDDRAHVIETLVARTKCQVMVFVHARNETVRTAFTLIELVKNRGDSCSRLTKADLLEMHRERSQIVATNNLEKH